MAAKKIIPIKKTKANYTTCSSCKYMVGSDEYSYREDNFCFYYPPTVLIDSEGDVFIARASIQPTDHICSKFTGNQ